MSSRKNGREAVYGRTPRLNGKVERSHRTDEQEFYTKQKLLNLEDLAVKLSDWQREYNEDGGLMVA